MFAGLMHNIGLLILHNSMHNKSGESNPLTAEELMQLDSEECQSNHQMVGAHFIDIWDLPFSIYEAALYHHKPTDSNIVHNELVAAVHIAQAYAWKVLTDTDIKPIDPQVFKILSISPEDFNKKLSRYLKQVKI
jgi:HD-like signal output (HDOD) protein